MGLLCCFTVQPQKSIHKTIVPKRDRMRITDRYKGLIRDPNAATRDIFVFDLFLPTQHDIQKPRPHKTSKKFSIGPRDHITPQGRDAEVFGQVRRSADFRSIWIPTRHKKIHIPSPWLSQKPLLDPSETHNRIQRTPAHISCFLRGVQKVAGLLNTKHEEPNHTSMFFFQCRDC